MNREYYLKGLDCPNCSAKIENDINKLEYVKSARVNLVKQYLYVEFDGVDEKNLDKDVKNIVFSYEPDVNVMTKEVSDGREAKKESHSHEDPHQDSENDDEDDSRKDLIKIIAGGVIYAAALILNAATDLPFPAYIAMLAVSYIILGGEIILNALKNIANGHIFDENFLMTVSTVGAFAIGEYPEAVAVMLFYTIGEFFQSVAVRRSRKSIKKLLEIRPETATVVRNGREITIDPEHVELGETLIIRPGERIPIDGTVTEGESSIDTKAVTGESLPKDVCAGDEVLSGCINMSGVLKIRTAKSFGESTASRIIELVENASSNKATAENFITTFAKYYTPAVVLAAALLAVLPPLFFGERWEDWLYRGFSFLVISCPCALVISIPLAYFGGIGSASRHGILVKGGNYLEALNSADTMVFDKTGTITKGVFKVSEIIPAEGITEKETLLEAAYAEAFSNHPIAKSITDHFAMDIDRNSISDYEEFSGYGVRAIWDGRVLLAGNEKLMESRNVDFSVCSKPGTKIYVAVDGKYSGCIIISDEIRPDSKTAIDRLKKLGIVKTVMLTGDSENIAADIAKRTGIDEYHAELLPHEKVEILKKLKENCQKNKRIAFAGDGINDAPSLSCADIGIAMGGIGSDAAIEAADFVIMTDEPSKIADAVKIARETKKTVIANIIFALGVKAIFLILSAFGLANMWQAVFADVGVALIAILNSIRILRK